MITPEVLALLDETALAAITQLMEGPMGLIFAAVWGAVWGSFYNVVIARVPDGESIMKPPSHCRNCKTQLRWFDNIPIISFLLLRGRCRYCGTTYSSRYMWVEVLVAVLSVGIYFRFIALSFDPILWRIAQFLTLSVFSGLLCAIALIDLKTFRIPNVITYPAIPVCAVLSLLMRHPHWWDGLVGAIAGYLLIRAVADGYELLTGRLGMGYGDAKLLAMIGGLLSWRVLLPTLFLASLQGSAIGITALVIARKRLHATQGEQVAPQADGDPEDNDALSSLRYAKLPFGPYISLAALELLLFWNYLPSFFPYLY